MQDDDFDNVYTPPLWAKRIAIRTVITGIVAIVAAIIVQRFALPLLVDQQPAHATTAPAATWAKSMRVLLVVLPMPGLALAILATASRRLRVPLAILSAVLTYAAVFAIVATLALALMPYYRFPDQVLE